MPDWFQNITTRDYVTQKPVLRVISTRTGREKHNSTTPFLQLPAEIRNYIYHMCLRTDDLVSESRYCHGTDELPFGTRPFGDLTDSPFISENRVDFRAVRLIRSWIGPLQVCRLMRKETSPIFYGSTYFDVQDRWDYRGLVQRWIASLPIGTMIRKVRFNLPNYCMKYKKMHRNLIFEDANLSIEIDFRKTPSARVHLRCQMHGDYDWREVGQEEHPGGLGLVLDRINGLDASGGAFKKDLLNVCEIVKQLEEKDQRDYADSLDQATFWCESNIRRSGLTG